MQFLLFVSYFLSSLPDGLKQNTLGYAVVAAAAVLVYPAALAVLRYIQQVYIFFQTRRRALGAVARVGSRRDRYEGDGPWVKIPVQHPEHYKTNITASKILAVANYKGGVGKTTFAGNVAACIVKEHEKSVLLIDLDFQGSLSSMAIATDDWQPAAGQASLASRAISGDIAPSEFTQYARRIWPENGAQVHGKLDLISAHYDVASADTRLLVEWLLNPRQRRAKTWREFIGHLYTGKVYEPFDLRYGLADLLHTDFVLSAYDLIIIDCPPRLTAGSMQALCASSHVIIPALMDKTSVEAVNRYADQLNVLKELNICPYLEPIGIVPTKFRDVNGAWAGVQRLRDEFDLNLLDVELLPEECFIWLRVALVDAQDEGIAYFALGDGQDVKTSIKNCAQFVMSKMGVN